jgi:hypothetical protein
MTSATAPRSTIYTEQPTQNYPASSLRFDWAVTLASLWFIAGMFLDGWAHNNLASSLESFFTPWHGVLYAGFFAVAGVLLVAQARNMARGHVWMQALPQGYLLALFGAALFSFGGAGDLVWHTFFGIESNMEALLSPTHLLLATGAMLFVTGPLRAAWVRSPAETESGWARLFPAIISLLMALSLLTFFTQYAHFMNNPALLVNRPSGDTYFAGLYGVSSALIPVVVIMGAVLLALRRWDLPHGTLTLLLTTNTALMWAMKFNRAANFWVLLLAAFAAGLVGDVLLGWLKPSVARLWALRVFAFSLPFALVLFNHLALIVTAGLWWKIHMWLGVPFVAGVGGLLLSFLSQPPAVPETKPGCNDAATSDERPRERNQ